MVERIKIFSPYVTVSLYAFALFVFQQTTQIFSIIFLLLMAILAFEKYDYRKILVLFSLVFTQPHFIFFMMSLLRLDFLYDRYMIALCAITFYIFFYFLWLGKTFWSWINEKQKIHLIVSLVAFIAISMIFSNMAIDCHYVSGAEKGVTHEEITMCSFFNLYTPGVRISGTFSGFYAIGTLMLMGISLVIPIIWLAQYIFYSGTLRNFSITKITTPKE